MLTNDLFNTDYERRLQEGAVDRLEQRRIDDLNMKMDDLANRVKSTSNPEHKKSLLKAFLNAKEERDGYYKVRTDEGSMKRWLESEALRLDKEHFVGNADEYGMASEEAAEWWDSINGVDEAAMGQPQLQQAPQRPQPRVAAQAQPGANVTTPGRAMPVAPKAAPKAAPKKAIPNIPGMEDALSNKALMTSIANMSTEKLQIALSDGRNLDPRVMAIMDLELDKRNVQEAGIGQDIANKTEKMARATPPTRAGAVASTVKNAAKWLAGKGGPGKEGPTYEGAEDIEDRGEYDQEGDMAKDNIHTIVRNAKELESILSDNDNLPEWVQDKLANIKGMMTAVSEYMQTQHERDHEEGVAIAEKLKGLPTKKLGSARDLGKSVRKFRAQRGLEEAGTDSQWSKEEPWTKIPKAKSGRPADPRGEVTHLSDVARREAERKADQKKNSKEVDEERLNEFLPALAAIGRGIATGVEAIASTAGELISGGVAGTRIPVTAAKIGIDNAADDIDEGFQDFNKVEPYAVCLAGKPVKKFDYYEEARRFHDNWKKKLYREGNTEKADKITLMPLHLDEEDQKPYNPNEFRPVGPITIVPPKKLKSGETHQGINDYWKAHGQAPIYKTNESEGRIDPILIKALNNMPAGLASHNEVLNACYDAYAMELGKMHMKSEYGTTRAYIPQLMDLYKQKHGLTFNEDDPNGGATIAIGQTAGAPADIPPTYESANPAQQAAIAIAMKKAGKKPKQVDEFALLPMTAMNAIQKAVTPEPPEWVQPISAMREAEGSWIVYDPETKQIKKRFKTHTAGKSYAKTHGLGFASSEYYFDNVKEKSVAEAQTDYQKRRQRERDVDAGKPVSKQRQPKMTDYQKRRAQDRKDMELGEESYSKVMESQGIIDAKLLKTAQRIDKLAKAFK